MTAETKYIFGSWNASNIKPSEPSIVTMKDFENMTDSNVPESEIIEKYQKQLLQIKIEGNLKSYKEEDLNGMKKALNIKRNAYAAILTGKSVTEDYWNGTLENWFKLRNFKPEIVKKEEQVTVKNPKTKELEIKNIMKVYVTNNLKNAIESPSVNVPIVLNFILNTFELPAKVETDFKTCLDLINSENIEDTINGHVFKANSELIKVAGDLCNEDLNNKNLTYNITYEKIRASIDFINWKLKQIKIFETEEKLISSDIKLQEYESKVQKYLKESEKGKSLRNIVAKTWSL